MSIKTASLFVIVVGILFITSGCKSSHMTVNPGQATYHHEEFSSDTGKLTSRTRVVFLQNEDPKKGATLRVYGTEVSIEWGASHLRKIPKSFAHMERILTIAGILSIIGAGVLAWKTHLKLAGLAGLTGLGFIALAATVEQYAWLYALGLFLTVAVVAWMIWSAYQTPSPDQAG